MKLGGVYETRGDSRSGKRALRQLAAVDQDGCFLAPWTPQGNTHLTVENRDQIHHTLVMIISFRHKGLRIFFETGSTKGIRADHAKRLARILSFMDRACAPVDLDIPGWRLHPLKGEMEEFWSLTVNGNWRVIFRFEGCDIELVDYLDYH